MHEHAPPGSPALHILTLVSNPLDASAVSVDDDLAALEEAVRDLPCAAEFIACAAEVDAVGDLLARHDRAPFTVLHYIGHGSAPDDAGSGHLVFESRTGAARPLSEFELHAALNPTGQPEFQLAVLSACHSAGVADAMFSLGIRHVVAIEADETVYEIAAVQFYRRFYRTLLTGGTVAQAFDAGS